MLILSNVQGLLKSPLLPDDRLTELGSDGDPHHLCSQTGWGHSKAVYQPFPITDLSPRDIEPKNLLVEPLAD